MRISDCSSDVCSSDLSPEIAENRAKLLTFPFQIGETFFRLGLFEKQHQAFSLLPADRDMSQDHDPFSGSLERDLGLTRSEEHTSELQSLMRISYAVFSLKKNNINTLK